LTTNSGLNLFGRGGRNQLLGKQGVQLALKTIIVALQVLFVRLQISDLALRFYEKD